MTRINVGRLRAAASAALDRGRAFEERQQSKRAPFDAAASDHVAADPVDKARRERERSKFPSDAEYFEFLVTRAIDASTTGAPHPEGP